MCAEQNQIHSFIQESSSPSSRSVGFTLEIAMIAGSRLLCPWLWHAMFWVMYAFMEWIRIRFNDYHLTFYSVPHTKLLYTTKEHFEWNTLSFGLHVYCFFWFDYTCLLHFFSLYCMYFKKWLWFDLKVGMGLVALK